jgi:hypothetical protein
VQALQAAEAHGLHAPVHDLGELVGRRNVEAGGEHVARVEAKPDPLVAAGQVETLAQLLERASECVAGTGRVLEEQRAALGLRERVVQRVRRLLPHLAILRGRVDQVDRVDQDRFDRAALAERQELGHVVGLPARGAPLARRLVEHLHRLAPALDGPLVRLHEAACRGYVCAN